jgi:hypothetical protein
MGKVKTRALALAKAMQARPEDYLILSPKPNDTTDKVLANVAKAEASQPERYQLTRAPKGHVPLVATTTAKRTSEQRAFSNVQCTGEHGKMKRVNFVGGEMHSAQIVGKRIGFSYLSLPASLGVHCIPELPYEAKCARITRASVKGGRWKD